ncbi:MAG TPA: bifunctional phosphopantothenoylcysteine decarboxylase/phosphopantothenate--cysteine ligase CoaBC [Desulfobacteria bacterium]|nr:bifunctional phosphopantothenoylcysteine decarboxylase/phosphopantothenate--cysteine ligase CoaBC [Desulfobacteria bacterium]
MLTDKCIIVGVTGGIAAYKVPDLVSKLVKAGADVHVIMTESATQFITPLTLRTISRNPVTTQMFEISGSWDVRHISLADRADLIVTVPATANIIGKVRAGIADDILTTTIMASHAPVLFAPAMNVHMYENAIVQDNISSLKAHGYHFIEPASGWLACGYEGKGRLPDVEVIYDKITGFFSNSADLEGRTFLITAGPTREFIDPVRFITNRSTGRMGYALARAARERGAKVILVSGPVDIPAPDGVTLIPVQSAGEMFEAVKDNFQSADVIIKAAAVADYTPSQTLKKKLKKGDGVLNLELDRTQDILKYLGENKGNHILVGFAAETDNLIENAQKKIQSKNLDMIVANDVTVPGAGFGTDTNIVKLLYRDGHIEELDKMSKGDVAHCILDRVINLK